MNDNFNELRIDISGLSLLKFAAPTMLSNIFMNVYSIVDQLFISNLLGTDALSATSISAPFLAICQSEQADLFRALRLDGDRRGGRRLHAEADLRGDALSQAGSESGRQIVS